MAYEDVPYEAAPYVGIAPYDEAYPPYEAPGMTVLMIA